MRADVSSGDSLLSALVLSSSSSPVLDLSSNGFVTRGNTSLTAGTFSSLSTLVNANNETYLAVVEAMIAAPASYSAQVVSTNSPGGLASGPFATQLLPGLLHRGGKGKFGQGLVAAFKNMIGGQGSGGGSSGEGN